MFDVLGSLNVVETAVAKSGYFTAGTQVGEPKGPRDGPGLSAAIFMTSAAIAATTLQHPIESHVVTVRLYQDMLAEPTADIELELSQALGQLIDDLMSDIDFGGEIRNIDAGGQYNTMSANWGYVDLGGTMYSIADLNVPLTVDDTSATFG